MHLLAQAMHGDGTHQQRKAWVLRPQHSSAGSVARGIDATHRLHTAAAAAAANLQRLLRPRNFFPVYVSKHTSTVTACICLHCWLHCGY